MGTQPASQQSPLSWTPDMTPEQTGRFEALLDDTYVNFFWTIWHEGVRTFDDGYPGSVRDIEAIRGEAIGKQAHNPGAANEIRAATNNQLRLMVNQAEAGVYSQFQLVANFQWVAYHEHCRDTFRHELSQRNFKGIRDLYFSKQNHNPNARNLLAAVSNHDIEVLVNSL